MKTAKKYTSLYFKNGITPSELNKITEAIKQAQSEVIDETVKACAEAAKFDYSMFFFKDGEKCVFKDDIFIDKQSIISVAEQLKAKL